jgi:hypothetical protein
MKKINLYVMLLFLCSIAACKKEEVNNPDIEDVILDFSIETTDPIGNAAKDLFIDGEALQDFTFVIVHPDDNPNQHLIQVDVYDSKYELLTNWEPGIVYTSIRTIQKGSNIQPILSEWKSGSFVLYISLTVGVTAGFTDIGDQYIAFRKKNSAGGYFYGWMLVNIENGEKITIKEYALHKIADTPIKAGEK